VQFLFLVICITHNKRCDAMSLSTPPQPIKAFLRATASRDRAALIASFANDAVLIDMGEEHRGEEIARWTDSFYLGSNVGVHPLQSVERAGGRR
jgi:hypothetical protein